METDDAPQGQRHNQRRARRNLDFKAREEEHKELAEHLANQMRLDDNAKNLYWANRDIRKYLEPLRERGLYRGYWRHIYYAIETHAILGRGTENQKRSIRRIIAQAFTQNDFDYIENGDPGEYAPDSSLIDIFSERVVDENQIRFANEFIDYIDIPSLEIGEGQYHYIEMNRRANEYIRNRIDGLSRIAGLWVHICNRINRQFRDYNGNLTDAGDARVKRIRNLIANVFIGNRFRFAQQAAARARNFDETSILFHLHHP